jgi:hypothetical protein
MLAKGTVVACVLASCLAFGATQASAKLLVTGHGRSPHTQAEMYDAAIFIGRNSRAQFLNRLCAKAASLKDCEPMPVPLRRALEEVLDRPISWVSRRTTSGPPLYVLAPIGWEGAEATASYAWRGTHKFSCFGGGSISFRRDHGAWTAFRGSAYIGCPAR